MRFEAADGSVWIGANCREEGVGYQWTDGEPFVYYNWFPGIVTFIYSIGKERLDLANKGRTCLNIMVTQSILFRNKKTIIIFVLFSSKIVFE